MRHGVLKESLHKKAYTRQLAQKPVLFKHGF